LQADLVLLGSLCQQSDKAQTLGETLTLFRTSDGKVIWSSSKGVSLLAEQRLLGINAPKNMAELQEILLRDLFDSWPGDLESRIGQATAQVQDPPRIADAAVQVDSVLFTPKYVRPGGDVTCTIRFKVQRDDGEAKVFIRVGNRIHTARTDDGLYYQVTWVGSDDKTGTPVQVAMNDPEPRIINGIWSGEPQDANYPVSLILEWPSGKRDELYLGTYVVDSVAPDVFLKVKAKSLAGVPVFRRELPFSVLFKRNEPIERWEFSVASTEGTVLLDEKGSDQPPASLLWRGQNRRNQRLDPGLYDLRIRVWDRAGNMGEASERVRLLSVTPGLDLAVTRDQGDVLATLSALDQVEISSWRMELWSKDNIMVETFEGESLPVRITLPESVGAGSGEIDCIVQVKDTLGMKATKKVRNFLVQVNNTEPGSESKDRTGGNEWHADF
ncbi:MAG: hypothetical protein Q8J76_13285, partial [Desulfobulbaceae bacterium]|nr:hypothetical protein [Desulfobulbaceae bacterium]